MATVNTPHDAFFKNQMGDRRVAAEFLKAHIPPWLQTFMDFSGLEPKPNSFVDESLRELITDKLFSIPFSGKQSYIYVLVEHQSTADPSMVFRVFQYMLRIMEPHIIERAKSPNIYPFVFYNGKKPYPYSMNFADLFEDPSLASDLLHKDVHLIDLHATSDEDLRKSSIAGLFQLCMKHIHDPNIVPFVRDSMDLMRHLEQAGHRKYIYSVLKYCIEAGRVDKIELIDIVKQGLSLPLGEDIMTTADFLRLEGEEVGLRKGLEQGLERGREKGREEGILLGQEKIALRLLQRGDSVQEVSLLTGLDDVKLKTLLVQELEQK